MKTIMAFVIRSCSGSCLELGDRKVFPCDEEIRSGTYNIKLANGLRIEFRKVDNVLTAHISGGEPGCHSSFNVATMLTKNEMDRILDGYPPFYREDMSSKTDKLPLDNPLRDVTDGRRAGWIVAIELAGLAPVNFYVDNDESHKCIGYPPTVQQALRRVLDILSKDIELEFPENNDVQAAIKTIQYIVDTCSESDRSRYMTAALKKHTSMKRDLANRVIQLFNRYSPLNDSEPELVHSNLLEVLRAAVWGSCRVVRYFQDVSVWIPLRAMTQEMIYLKDCGGKQEH